MENTNQNENKEKENIFDKAYNLIMRFANVDIPPLEPPKNREGLYGKKALFVDGQAPYVDDSSNKDYYERVRFLESSNRSNIKAATSSAYGPYQFTKSTWNKYVKKLGKNYTLEDRADHNKALEIVREYTNDNRVFLEKGLGRLVDDAELYMAHFLGPSGAKKLLQAKDDSLAHKLFPAAASSNKNIFFVRGSNRPRTVGEVKDLLRDKYNSVE